MGKHCYLRQNANDVRDYAKYDGTLMGILTVQGILPPGWSCSYTLVGFEGRDVKLSSLNKSFMVDPQTYVVVDRFGEIEIHDPSSFYYLFREDGEPEEDNELELHVMADDGFIWG